MTKYDKLKTEVRRLRAAGILGALSPEDRADWAYGTTKIENDDVTLQMAEEAAKSAPKQVRRAG